MKEREGKRRKEAKIQERRRTDKQGEGESRRQAVGIVLVVFCHCQVCMRGTATFEVLEPREPREQRTLPAVPCACVVERS